MTHAQHEATHTAAAAARTHTGGTRETASLDCLGEFGLRFSIPYHTATHEERQNYKKLSPQDLIFDFLIF